ncbi:unnamed protein product [Acanthoscelides obtectus]|uniref:Ubiquinone biosynthesis protein COQ4 homolog, mitochondrial n=1 Tax=Acanthoscelides obtectus TaxID=200917 RepID=A0A9P0KH72_ACAOB|nr:unnamed protein product [Acanthoscelides obtectus]CAK1644657.1 hypothetical protein AOBTE_LOCUS13911 [Acanthoscelides obtectus]
MTKLFNTVRVLQSSRLQLLLRCYSQTVSNFEEYYQHHHIPTNSFQKILLTAGSAAVSLLNPFRADMIACLGETSGVTASRYILEKMKESEEGSRILADQPRINTNTIDLSYLRNLPEGTLGKTYFNFLVTNKVTPDSRDPVRFVDDIELAYVLQRYREAHDLIHTVLQMPTNMLGEVTVKWVEALQFKLPMCVAGGIFGAIRLKPKQRQNYVKYYLPWAIDTGQNAKFLMNVYYEERWEQSLDEFHNEYNIKPLIIEKKYE